MENILAGIEAVVEAEAMPIPAAMPMLMPTAMWPSSGHRPRFFLYADKVAAAAACDGTEPNERRHA